MNSDFSPDMIEAFRQQDQGLDALLQGMGVGMLIGLAVGIVTLIATWRIFTKAGKPGWACLIPVYGTIVLLDIVKRPAWWLALILFVPVANIVVLVIVSMDLAECFGKSKGWGVGMLVILSVIGYCILGFGPAQYEEPARMA